MQYTDPRCRYAAAARVRPDVVHHVCVRNDGQPIGPDGDCYYEAASRLRDAELSADILEAHYDGCELFAARWDA